MHKRIAITALAALFASSLAARRARQAGLGRRRRPRGQQPPPPRLPERQRQPQRWNGNHANGNGWYNGKYYGNGNTAGNPGNVNNGGWYNGKYYGNGNPGNGTNGYQQRRAVLRQQRQPQRLAERQRQP